MPLDDRSSADRRHDCCTAIGTIIVRHDCCMAAGADAAGIVKHYISNKFNHLEMPAGANYCFATKIALSLRIFSVM